MGGVLHIADRTDGVNGVRLSLALPLVLPPGAAAAAAEIHSAEARLAPRRPTPTSPSAQDASDSAAAAAAGVTAPELSSVCTPPPTLPRPAPRGADAARVLLVDDSAGNRRIGERMLVSLGCAVGLACDGDEVAPALSSAAASGAPYDVVLMDVWMARQNGDDACAALRAAGCAVHILAVTANVGSVDRAKYAARGFSGVLAKPFSVEELREALRAVGVPRAAAAPG